MTKFRKCYVLREQEIPMGDLKKGDVFRLGKASPDDSNLDEEQFSLAESDAEPAPPDGNVGVKAQPIAFTPICRYGLRLRAVGRMSGFKKGDKVSWKVPGFPDATGVVHSDQDPDGKVFVDSGTPGAEDSGLSLRDSSDLTLVVRG